MINRILKRIDKHAPSSLSRIFVNIPFEYRFGKVYINSQKTIKSSENWTELDLESYVIKNFERIFQHSKSFKFYRDKYKKSGVLNLSIKSLEDIKKVPILTRQEIRDGISEFNGPYLETTAGTSGNPLSIYVDKNAWAREYAHFHHIWGKARYKWTDTKFVLKRQNLKDDFIKYNFFHNEYVINTFKMEDHNIEEFFQILTNHKVKYFHGYPSAINDFLKEIDEKITKEQKKILKEQVECCFLGSEYPTPQVLAYLKNEWKLNFISWYGHSEVCVLAATKMNELNYFPFHTYGYVEEEDKMLLGTSYHNFDMPLIRYKTDDLVESKRYRNGIVESFNIEQGRIFDLVIDKNDLRITVNRLIRHTSNRIFNYANHVQVYQEKKGYVTFLISHNKKTKIDARELMNLEEVDIEFDFIYLKNPIRTNSGKVPLRVRNLPKNI